MMKNIDVYELKNMSSLFIDKVYMIDAGSNDYTLKRIKNSKDGNPRYRLTQTYGEFIHSKVALRNYKSKSYYLLEAYSIKDKLTELFQDLELNILKVEEVQDV